MISKEQATIVVCGSRLKAARFKEHHLYTIIQREKNM